MLNCKQASLLASKKMDQSLSFRESLALSLHLSMCRLCRRYIRSLKIIRRSLRQQEKQIQQSESVKLPQSARQRIQEKIQKMAETQNHPPS